MISRVKWRGLTYSGNVITICDFQIVVVFAVVIRSIALNFKVKKGNDDELVWVCSEDV